MTTKLTAAPQAAAAGLLSLPPTKIELQAGEIYAGLVLGADGRPSHHLILLPGEKTKTRWTAATKWAATAGNGASLPTRQEQALLYANLKREFEATWYWSSDSHEQVGSSAWGQDVGGGCQSDGDKSFQARARAVRRFPA